MADWITCFENNVFRVQTVCVHPHMRIRVLILADPDHFRDGIASEYFTNLRCSNSRGLLTLLNGLVAERTSADYRPHGAWEESMTHDDTIGTQIFEYRELPEADPAGDYEILYKGRITEESNPTIVLTEHTTTFKINRNDLVAIAKALIAALKACCHAELALRDDPRRQEHRV
jgi:hypothetical protein